MHNPVPIGQLRVAPSALLQGQSNHLALTTEDAKLLSTDGFMLAGFERDLLSIQIEYGQLDEAIKFITSEEFGAKLLTHDDQNKLREAINKSLKNNHSVSKLVFLAKELRLNFDIIVEDFLQHACILLTKEDVRGAISIKKALDSQHADCSLLAEPFLKVARNLTNLDKEPQLAFLAYKASRVRVGEHEAKQVVTWLLDRNLVYQSNSLATFWQVGALDVPRDRAFRQALSEGKIRKAQAAWSLISASGEHLESQIVALMGASFELLNRISEIDNLGAEKALRKLHIKEEDILAAVETISMHGSDEQFIHCMLLAGKNDRNPIKLLDFVTQRLKQSLAISDDLVLFAKAVADDTVTAIRNLKSSKPTELGLFQPKFFPECDFKDKKSALEAVTHIYMIARGFLTKDDIGSLVLAHIDCGLVSEAKVLIRNFDNCFLEECIIFDPFIEEGRMAEVDRIPRVRLDALVLLGASLERLTFAAREILQNQLTYFDDVVGAIRKHCSFEVKENLGAHLRSRVLVETKRFSEIIFADYGKRDIEAGIWNSIAKHANWADIIDRLHRAWQSFSGELMHDEISAIQRLKTATILSFSYLSSDPAAVNFTHKTLQLVRALHEVQAPNAQPVSLGENTIWT